MRADGLELFAKIRDVHPYDVDLRLIIPAPHALHDALGGKDLPRRAHEKLHDLELTPAQADGVLPAAQIAAAGVERQIAVGEHRRLVGLAAAQDGAHAAQELVGVEGLGKIVVRAGVEARDAVTLLALGREHHDGRFHALLPQLFEHLNTVHLGHHHV